MLNFGHGTLKKYSLKKNSGRPTGCPFSGKEDYIIGGVINNKTKEIIK